MNLITNAQFGEMSINVFDNGKEFYMSRKQINEALEYKDEKTLARIISRNKDIIGEGTKMPLTQFEGERQVTREIEIFAFRQVFHILRFSRSEKADAFMEFTALTMEQLLSGKADLEFRNQQDKEDYIRQAKDIIAECKTYGITKTKASLLIQEAKVNNLNPDSLILEELRKKREVELEIKRGRINERIAYLASEYLYDDYEEAWHMFSEEMRFEIGKNMRSLRSKAKKQREKDKSTGKRPMTTVPSYLDFIEKYDVYQQAEKVIKRLIKKLESKLPKVE